jgi:hypothetical protein
MKTHAVLVLAFLVACSSNNDGTPANTVSDAGPTIEAVAIPNGSALLPYNAANPSLARPEGMAMANGNVFVALANYDEKFAVRGPGMLAEYVPASGSVTLINLGGSDGQLCKEPGFVREANGFLYAVCGGDFNDGSGTAVVEVDPTTHLITRSIVFPTSPAGIAAGPTRLWVGDGFGGNLYAIDKSTFQIVAGPIAFPCPTTGTFTSTNDVLVSDGDLYALCSNNTGGILSRLDSNTGALKMQADSGPTSVEMADIGDGRLAIISGADNSLRIVTIGTSLAVQVFPSVYVSATATLQDVRAHGHFLFTAASGSNTVQKIDLDDSSGRPTIVSEVSTGIGANPWNVLPLDDDHAVVSNQSGNNLSKVAW